jgi:hypothetical protein
MEYGVSRAVGLVATPDPATIHEMAIAISTEGRIKHVQSVRDGHKNIMEGLISGRRTLTSFAILDGDAVKRPTAKILF